METRPLRARMVRAALCATLAAALLGLAQASPRASEAEASVVPASLALGVDVSASRKPISPYIYGLHYADATFADEIDLPVRRWGGNDTTRYNWQINAFGNGSDFYFENNPKGISADQFIQRDRGTGTATLMTLPLIGYVAKDDHSCGFSTITYNYTPKAFYDGNGNLIDPGYDTYDPARSFCGNGIKASDSSFVTGNDPADTSTAIGDAFVTNWINHLTQTFGAAANGGVKFYSLDNEPGLWHETHRDVHPAPLTYDEIYNRTVQYAAAIKAADPGALVLGPVQDGWTRYWYASYRSQAEADADRLAHGGAYFIPWYLQQMKAYEDANGVRLVDYLDLHDYPQNGVDLRDAGDATLQALRLRSTRSLWDPTYVDESWIAGAGPDGGIVRLIPRMREWINAHYPGTRIAITEYNWGGLEHINGALTQVDILGIFGREGVDLATFFDTPYGGGAFTPTSPGAFAFRIYRNYDGGGGKFGDVSVSASSADQSQLAVYAAQRTSDSALTLVVINKTGGALTGDVSLAGFTPAAAAEVYGYSDANLNAIVREVDQAVGAGGFSVSFPANSVTLFVIPSASPQFNVFLPLVQR